MRLELLILAAVVPLLAALPSAAEAKSESVIVAGGCFWCVDSMFRQVKGVTGIECAYAGGSVAHPSYEQVCSGTTGHAEAVKITFDPKVISAENMLKIFMTAHDPTTLNRQGPDEGTQYRSVIFYRNDAEKALAKKVIAEITKERIYDAPIVTTVEPPTHYTRAEEYHQDYYDKFLKAGPTQKMAMNGGYCNAVVRPKALKFREKFAKYIK